jgi:hypothetical protein
VKARQSPSLLSHILHKGKLEVYVILASQDVRRKLFKSSSLAYGNVVLSILKNIVLLGNC